MTTMLGSAVSGMVHHQRVLDTVANNLANVSSPTFKVTRAVAEGRPDATQDPDASRLGVATTTYDPNFRVGQALGSEDPLHFTIGGDGFFRVRDLDGSVAYSRFGALSFDGAGNVTAFRGRFLEPPVTLPEGYTSPAIDANGVIAARDPDGALQPIGQISLVRFMNPQALAPLGDGLYAETVNSGQQTEGTPGDGAFEPLIPGTLEGSNVDAAEEFTNMIIAQRAYQAAARTFSVGDQMIATATNLTR